MINLARSTILCVHVLQMQGVSQSDLMVYICVCVCVCVNVSEMGDHPKP